MAIIELILSIIAIIIGIILGFYFSSLFALNIKYVGPNSKDFKKKVFRSVETGQCYKLVPEICIST